ncbi:MAG: NADH-quinone oxidoreductase subunit N [Armatimonadetes bacterium]|nr:NADH-quinone oxidoreductase subunit N [Armatimonadota bacterium]
MTRPVISADLGAVAPELIVAVAALLALTVDLFLPAERRRVLLWVSLAGIALAFWSAAQMGGASRETFGGMYVRDGLTNFLQMLVLAAAGTSLLLAAGYVRRTGLESGEFYMLALSAALGAMLMAASRDLVLLFLGLETLSIPLYVMAAILRLNPRSQEAGLKYFLLGAFATAFFLYGIALIYGATGTTNFVAVAAKVRSAGLAGDPLLGVGIGFLTIGLGFKAAAVPFHSWAPDVYEGAPLPITAFMAVVAKIGAFAAFLRVFPLALPDVAGRWSLMLAAVAVLTMILGNAVALLQTNVKRLLAYSSIAHAGYLLVGIVAAGSAGVWSVLYYLAAYTFMTLGAFGVVLAFVGPGGREADELADLQGAARGAPWLGAAMAVCMMALAGLPPTGGFIAKLYVFTAAVESGHLWLVVVGVLTSVVSAYYYLRVAYVMFTGEPRPGTRVVVSPGTGAGIVIAVALVMALGVLPAPVTTLAQRVAQQLIAAVK